MSAKSSPETVEACIALHGLGWIDRKIASALGVTPTCIGNWRKERGLRANGKLASIDSEAARHLHANGWGDTEIAEKLGVSQSGVTRWRQRNGLECNSVHHRVNAQQRRKIKQMLREGGSARAVGRATGFSKKTILEVRKSMPSDGLRGTGETVSAQRKRIANSPALRDEIENALGRHLPPHILADAAADMISDLYDGYLLESAIEKAAPRYRSAAYKMCGSNFEHARLDAENDDGLSLLDTLIDDFTEDDMLDAIGP